MITFRYTNTNTHTHSSAKLYTCSGCQMTSWVQLLRELWERVQTKARWILNVHPAGTANDITSMSLWGHEQEVNGVLRPMKSRTWESAVPVFGREPSLHSERRGDQSGLKTKQEAICHTIHPSTPGLPQQPQQPQPFP